MRLNPVVEQEISGILTTSYHHGKRVLEREAFSVQGHPDAIGRVIAALPVAVTCRWQEADENSTKSARQIGTHRNHNVALITFKCSSKNIGKFINYCLTNAA